LLPDARRPLRHGSRAEAALRGNLVGRWLAVCRLLGTFLPIARSTCASRNHGHQSVCPLAGPSPPLSGGQGSLKPDLCGASACPHDALMAWCWLGRRSGHRRRKVRGSPSRGEEVSAQADATSRRVSDAW